MADGFRDGGVVVVKEVIWLAGLGELVDIGVLLTDWLGYWLADVLCSSKSEYGPQMLHWELGRSSWPIETLA